MKSIPKEFNPTDISKTWMLFESGSGVAVDLSLHEAPREKNRPIDAYVVTECEGDFTGSARRAAEAVYDVVRQYRPDQAPVVVGYDLNGLPSGMAVTGESGGLAFAIALAKRLFNQDPGPVAATGEVKSGHNGGPVGAVKGIEAKLEAAEGLLPEKGRVFYPKENSEISDRVLKSLKDKGLKVCPVSSVAEALDELFALPELGAHGEANSPNRWRTVLLGALLLILLGGLGSALWVNDWHFFLSDVPSDNGKTPPVVVSESDTEKGSAKEKSINDKSKGESPRSSLVTIDIAGKTPLTNNLAQLLTDELEDIFRDSRGIDFQPTRVSGRVVILEIKEDPIGNGQDVGSSMTAALTGLTCNTHKGTKSFSIPQVKVHGKDVKSLLAPSASGLATEIVRVLRIDRDRNRDVKFEDTGFE